MIEIKFERENKRAVAKLSNKEIGTCIYTEDNDTWNIIKTNVLKEYSGKGIARKLVNSVIKNSKKENKKVISTCSYANKIINERKREK